MRNGLSVHAAYRCIEGVVRKLADGSCDLRTDSAHRVAFIDDEQPARLAYARHDRLEIEWHDRAQINDFAVNPLSFQDSGRLHYDRHHPSDCHYRDVLPGTHEAGNPKGN